MNKDNLGDRMKGYENITRNHLVRRIPVMIRIDGKAFHTFTRGMEKPFDKILMESMWETVKYLCTNIQGCKLGYTQSDEISLLLTDYEKLDTDAWFDNNIQKMASISSSMATLAFNKNFIDIVNDQYGDIGNSFNCDKYISKYNKAIFDSRVFNIPKEEVCNCFIWRQQDATRNAIEAVGRAYFSHKQLYRVNCNQIQEMLFQEKGINFNDLPTYEKRGVCIVKEQYTLDNEEKTIRSRWIVDKNIPIFTQDRNYIEKYL
jgi:tRNA(His) 5'-end guanylyltransferase